jgi:hypothetical protein
MSYKENPHFHQSELLTFLPKNYFPFRESKKGVKTFGVIILETGKFRVEYVHNLPKYGGYLSTNENIFGNPTYCPNATRHHKKHMELYGKMPHLVFFDSEKTAIKAGFRKCKICQPA